MPDKRDKSNTGLIIGIVAVALVIIGAGCWWYFGYRDAHPFVTEGEEVEEVTEVTYSDGVPGGEATEISPAEGNQASGEATTATSGESSQTSAANAADLDDNSIYNRPLTYTGTVTPGGVATLNIMLFKNGRIEGTLEYSGGESMPLFGSYNWTDDGHVMDLNFTVSSNSDKTYSESWMGQSSRIKEDMAHTLTFKRINTSKGLSKTASFALSK